ncbi:cobalt-precorrin-6A reductase [Methylocystis rosea]|uniref:cobalt-precorrin-6A reductase n=1 Tax=Methylocystis rosea TaxID=173366 RepID=UPI001FDF8CA8|nr:cobalt-precorrin-6A reductase [Methylocystis rosea]
MEFGPKGADSACSHSSAPTERRRALVLGGSSQARALATRIAADPHLAGVISLAGRTSAPIAHDLPTRVGGFGGVEGLTRYLIEERISHVVDATHPFAARISANARAACAVAGVPLLVLTRPPWVSSQGDRWIDVDDNAAAVSALGAASRRVFLAIGRQGVADFRAAPQHDYLLRVIEPPDSDDLPPSCEVIFGRGPFALEDEIALMREGRIEIVVTKNSGGALAYAKIEAARMLRLDVVMIARPASADAATTHSIDAAMAFLAS